ncbi:MAG: DUF1232 domain-containing protein [Chloroflexia bacterium]|nr:DUF1232 domain-containing protein [Chloroflexia bacterium]
MTLRHRGQAFRSANVILAPGGLDNLRLTWRLARDRRVAPVYKLLVPIAILLYVISPIDLIPDFLLGIGQVDDLGLIGIALMITFRLLPRLAPAAVVNQHLAEMGRPSDHWRAATHSPNRDQAYVDTAYRVHDSPASRS